MTKRIGANWLLTRFLDDEEISEPGDVAEEVPRDLQAEPDRVRTARALK